MNLEDRISEKVHRKALGRLRRKEYKTLEDKIMENYHWKALRRLAAKQGFQS